MTDDASGGAADVDDEPAPVGDAPAVDPADLPDRLRGETPLVVLDVRDRDEFEAWHLAGPAVEAIQAPYPKFVAAEARGTVAEYAADLGLDRDDAVLVVCARGESSAHVARLLGDAGIDAASLAGGMGAWARLYLAAEVSCEAATVRQYRRPSSGCLAYLVVRDGEAAAIDPLRAFADRYAADARDLGADLRYAIDTHVHADHVSGIRTLAAATGADPVLPAGARDRGLAFDAHLVADGDRLSVGDAALTAVALPGHTSEMTGFRLADLLFGGDTVFSTSVARPDLEAGAAGAPALARRLHATLRDRVLALPDDVLVLPGHYADRATPTDAGPYAATVGDLRERLAALSLDEAAFVERITGDVPPRPANYREIIGINLGRRPAADEEAFELELGPNNCAV
ncbi:MAG: MBL fold metallo-hydrolase [Haloferacaceae archaeon]